MTVGRALDAAFREGGCDIRHEPRHFVFDLRVRLKADVEVEDYLVETRRLDLFQGVGDLSGGTE